MVGGGVAVGGAGVGVGVAVEESVGVNEGVTVGVICGVALRLHAEASKSAASRAARECVCRICMEADYQGCPNACQCRSPHDTATKPAPAATA
jgi:hypothetical protein